MTLTSFCDRDRSRTSYQQEVSIANGYCHLQNNFCPPAELKQLTGAGTALPLPRLLAGVLCSRKLFAKPGCTFFVDSKRHSRNTSYAMEDSARMRSSLPKVTH